MIHYAWEISVKNAFQAPLIQRKPLTKALLVHPKIKLPAKALLLISVDLGDERNVLKKLKSIQNVKELILLMVSTTLSQ
jgi:hypothetical protein